MAQDGQPDEDAEERGAQPDDTPLVGAAESDTDPEDEQPEGMTESEKRLLIGMGAVAAVILLIIVGINVFSGDGGDEDSAEATDDTAVTAAEPSPEAFGDGGGIVDVPDTVAARSETVTDSFDRDSLEGGPLEWSVLGSGGWEVQGSTLTVAAEPADVSPLALTEVPSSLGGGWDFSITIGKRANGIGLVWGVTDEENYWEMRANLDYAAIVINHVKDGATEQVTIIGPAGVGEGQRLSVQHQGDTVTLSGNDEPFFSLKDPSLTDPRKVGVIAPSGSGVSFSEASLSTIDASG